MTVPRAVPVLLVAALLLAGTAPVRARAEVRAPPAGPVTRVVRVPAERANARPTAGVLTVPSGWRKGNPAVLLVSHNPWMEDWKYDLAELMMERGAAVMELDIHGPRGDGPDEPGAVLEWSALDLLPEIFGALRALRGPLVGAGSVVVLGDGRAGEAALLAASATEVATPPEADATGFSAGAALGWGCRTVRAASSVSAAGTAGPHPGWRVTALREGAALAVRGFQPGRLSAQAMLCAAALLPAGAEPKEDTVGKR